MSDGLDAARALLPGVRLGTVARLGGGERTTVERVRATYADGTSASLVVKRYHSAGEGWVREAAALAVLPDGARGPRLVAAAGAPPLVITADEGAGPSVAAALLGDDPDAAESALVAWAEALATLHASTRHLRASFRSELSAREGDVHVADNLTAVWLEDTVRLLDRHCALLGVRVPAGAFDELRNLGHRLGGSGTAALSPSDTCPDNNVRAADGVVLLDFEDAQWRHVAWDVACLRVPWPTCWCSWRMPDGVAAAALAAYRQIAAPAFPEIAGDEFDRQLAAAEGAWALATAGTSLGSALGSDPPADARRPAPPRRGRILHRLSRAAVNEELPAAAELARRLTVDLTERWGDVPLEYAKAFRFAQ